MRIDFLLTNAERARTNVRALVGIVAATIARIERGEAIDVAQLRGEVLEAAMLATEQIQQVADALAVRLTVDGKIEPCFTDDPKSARKIREEKAAALPN